MKVKIPGQWSTNRISAAVLASVLVFTSGAAAIVAVKPATSIQQLLSGGAYVVYDNAYVHVNTATGKPDLRGFTEEKINHIVQQDGNAVLYTSEGAVPVSRRTMRTGTVIKPRVKDSSGFTGVETGVAPNQDFYTVLERENWVQREKGQRSPKADGRINFKTKIAPLVGGRDGTLVVIKPDTAQIATVFSGKLKKTISFGSSEPEMRLTAGRVDGKAVVVDPASGKIVVFKNGSVVRRVGLGLTGTVKVSSNSETGELAIVLTDSQSVKRLLVVDIDTGTVREVPVPDGALKDLNASPLVTPGAIYLYNEKSGPPSLVAFDSESGEKLSDDADFKGLAKGANVEVVNGSVIVDNRDGSDAWVISSPDRIHKVDKEDKNIPNVNEDPTPPPPPPPPPPPSSPAAEPSGRKAEPPPRVVVKPGAPVLSGTAGNKTATLSWTPPDAGGGVIQEYRITCDRDCGTKGDGTNISQIPGTATVQELDGLDNQVDYRFTIAARNDAPGNAWGPESNQVELSPNGKVPRPPNAVTVKNYDAGAVEVAWTPDLRGFTGTVTGYDLYMGVPGVGTLRKCGRYTPITFDVRVGDCYAYDEDDIPDVQFYVRTIGSVDNVEVQSGPSKVSSSIDPYRAPAAPGVTVVPVSKGKAQVTVTKGTYADRPVHYELTASGVPGTGTPAQLATPGSFEVTGLSDAPSGYEVTATAVYNDPSTPMPNKSGPVLAVLKTPLAPTVSVEVNPNNWNSATVRVSVNWNGTPPGTCSDSGGRSSNCGSFTVSSTGNQTFTGTITATNLYGQTGTGTYNFTTPAQPPPPSPSVSISKGTQLSVPGCSTSNCFRVDVAVLNMAGDYTVSCFTEGQSGAFYSYTTASATSATCVWGNWSNAPGTLYVTVNGVRSNNA